MKRKTIDLLAIRLVREKVAEYESVIRSSMDVHAVAKSLLGDSVQEEVWGFYLDVRGKLVCARMIGRGTTDECPVSPTDIFRPCLLTGTKSVIVVHNHPSGEPEPSREDIQITQRLVEGGRLLGIRVLDHVIIGSCRYFSFADEGML